MLDYILFVVYDLLYTLFFDFLCFLANYLISFYLIFVTVLLVSIMLLFGLCCACLFCCRVIVLFFVIMEIMLIRSRSSSMRCFSNLFISTRSYFMLCFIRMIVTKMVTFQFTKSTFGIWRSLSKFSILFYIPCLDFTYLKCDAC